VKIPIFQVDAFTDRMFSGNPAAVCPLDIWLPDQVLQSIAAENNLAETAFFVRRGSGFDLRWFTPTVEVDLCGHATLASAHVLFECQGLDDPEILFNTKSGELRVSRKGNLLALNFPARPPASTNAPPALLEGLRGNPEATLASRDYMVVYRTEQDVRGLEPDVEKLKTLDRFAVIATAPGSDCDFVSRFFAPAQGIPEDPVTGSAHCTLIPYWAQRLGRTKLHAKQISKRGGELFCELKGDRVEIAGHATLYMQGSIQL
jgi:predicted PhzF superfamily epimerase YddE/YHI9